MFEVLYTIKQIINRRTLCSYNITMEEFNKLDPEVQQMILQDFWNKCNPENEKVKKITNFNNKRY